MWYNLPCPKETAKKPRTAEGDEIINTDSN